MLDIYSLLYLPRRRKGHIFSVLAAWIGINAKTVKRTAERNKLGKSFDIHFWQKHGELSDEDWAFVQSELPFSEKIKCIGTVPDTFRFIHPGNLKYAGFIFGFQQELMSHEDYPPLLKQACQFVLDNLVFFSQVIFALSSNNLKKYNEVISNFHIPVSLPTYEMWHAYFITKQEKALEDFFQEIDLLLMLTFDMSVMAWALTGEYKEGKSYIIESFMKFKKDNDVYFRKKFFQNMKVHIQEHLKLDKELSNEQFYLQLAKGNVDGKDAIKKQCTRIFKNESPPTPENLDAFLDGCLNLLGIENKDTRERQLFQCRTEFAYCIMLDAIQRKYIEKKYPSAEAFFDRLASYGEWLCKEVFHCPFPYA